MRSVLVRLPALVFLAVLLVVPSAYAQTKPAGIVVNDITQLNPIKVDRVVKPHSIEEIQALVKSHSGPISIGGGQFSQGGQTAFDGALFIDLREFNKVVGFSEADKSITVQPGITWRTIQDYIDPHNLSLQIMQTYSNFTVGGSLSVNVHGRYVGKGPLVQSVQSIKLVLADGSLIECSPKVHSDIFYAAIGGYGGIGVIAEATLNLADNVKVERRVVGMPATQYRQFFFNNIRNDKTAIFTNGDIYPPDFDTVSSVTWYQTSKPLTVEDRLIPKDVKYVWEPRILNWIAEAPFGRQLREYVIDPYIYRNEMVVWRNHEASYDVHELEPKSRDKSTFVLQEYFVPVEKFEEFIPKMREVFSKNDVDVVNVSIRHALPDPGTLLAWARTEVFAFVVYYKQDTDGAARAHVGDWTRQMVDAVLSVGGDYYLPYQPHATPEQFHRAYPNAAQYFALKEKLDPTFKFRNKLLDKYAPSSSGSIERVLQGIKGYQRAESNTFLTVPEWYIVFNPQEYAEHLKSKPPSSFPYFASIAEFWRLYGHTYSLTKDKYPMNWGAHLMNLVIGTSYTVELAIKGVYENTIGRLSEWVSSPALTQEDQLIQKYNAEYVQFIYVYPWYEFPFWSKLKEFWKTASWQGDNFPRKIERRLFFSSEFLIKTAYGWLIGLGSKSVYDEDEGKIYSIVENLSQHAERLDDRLKVIQRFPNGKTIIVVPRYEPFREVVGKLAVTGARFDEIAGSHKILVTIITPAVWKYDFSEGAAVFQSAVVTDSSVVRLGVLTDVKYLNALVVDVQRKGFKLEHIFDY
ncbi:FAD-binding protein [Stenotrophobium rhamnosiphilum]|uniref:Dehydrogenase n=1 Tax=Stenotrophobium rhamnosiphilum TaxID=2029166 RepID=A0A2T5MK65_9GAMM|nr:FAD-binding oxidoreductase [Stenotrophobium rhamnosiphilum]PTU32958.1 dehydrogenase [Stenotrophobium rhamnosiphilum]